MKSCARMVEHKLQSKPPEFEPYFLGSMYENIAGHAGFAVLLHGAAVVLTFIAFFTLLWRLHRSN